MVRLQQTFGLKQVIESALPVRLFKSFHRASQSQAINPEYCPKHRMTINTVNKEVNRLRSETKLNKRSLFYLSVGHICIVDNYEYLQ